VISDNKYRYIIQFETGEERSNVYNDIVMSEHISCPETEFCLQESNDSYYDSVLKSANAISRFYETTKLFLLCYYPYIKTFLIIYLCFTLRLYNNK
jgi:hypothetical protein